MRETRLIGDAAADYGTTLILRRRWSLGPLNRKKGQIYIKKHELQQKQK